MNPDRWRQVEAIFDAAVDLEPHEREAFLDRHCGDDAELRNAVEQLLVSSERAAGMFETPPVHVARQLLADDARRDRDHVAEGDVIGPYRVVRLLGRGGMGAVYLAERADGQFQKQVALKIVKRGMDTDEILDRFRRERQILARLEHPNIAGLLDGGVTPAGLPYFVMELSEGQPIDRWCDDHRATIDERLRLFLTVCDAVQYAHRNLVVHRDLKPSNIIVSDGVPKLLDFGIAKMLADEDMDGPPLTRLYSRRLTPEYAAPEQITGEATTTATDVYSLGVILHELLTGRSPYGEIAGGMTDIESVLKRTDTKPPSTVIAREAAREPGREEMERIAELRGTRVEALRNKLRGDLDAIVCKALQQEPERRYETAAALADDIRRHLNGEPVVARPDTPLYRWSKFVKRNRKTVALAAAAVAALVLGIVGTTWQAVRATRAQNAASEAAERATAARAFLLSIFASLNPDQLQGRTTFTRDEILAMGRANLGQLRDNPPLQAAVMNALGEIMFSLGDLASADSLFRRAYTVLARFGDELEMSASLMGMGEVLRLHNRFIEAEAPLRRALAIRTEQLDPGHPDRQRAMLALAYLYYNQGTEESRQRGEDLYNQVLAYRGDVDEEIRGAAFDGLGDIYAERARAASGPADSAARRLAWQQSERYYRNAIAEYTAGLGSTHPKVALAKLGLAISRFGQGAHEEAIQIATAVRNELEVTYGSPHYWVLQAQLYLSLFVLQQGRYVEAEQLFRRAAADAARIFPDGHSNIAASWQWIGVSELRQGNLSGALSALTRSLNEYERLVASGNLSTTPGNIHYWLATALNAQNRYREAFEHAAIARERWLEEQPTPDELAELEILMDSLQHRLGVS